VVAVGGSINSSGCSQKRTDGHGVKSNLNKAAVRPASAAFTNHWKLPRRDVFATGIGRGCGSKNVITQFSVPGAAKWDIMAGQ
jgi:hypothetical protein